MSQPHNMPISEELLNAIKKWLNYNTNPEDIFAKIFLEEWAEANGYTKNT